MELSLRVKHALDALESPDFWSRAQAVEDLAACAVAIAERVASAFAADEDARWVIAERLGGFGSLMLEPMERVYREADDEGLRQMTASLLLRMGSSVGVPSLMRAVEPGNPHLLTAAAALSRAGISEAAELIESAILECDLSDFKALDILVSSLRDLNVRMSEPVYLRLSRVEQEWFRDSLIKWTEFDTPPEG